jgi:hypothetical protein
MNHDQETASEEMIHIVRMRQAAWQARASSAHRKGFAIFRVTGGSPEEPELTITDHEDCEVGGVYMIKKSDAPDADTTLAVEVVDGGSPIKKRDPTADLAGVHSRGISNMLDRYEVALRETDARLAEERKASDKLREDLQALREEIYELRQNGGGELAEILPDLVNLAKAWHEGPNAKKAATEFLQAKVLPLLDADTKDKIVAVLRTGAN